MREVTVRRESPRTPEVFRLIEALDAYLSALYPPESNHFLDVEALAAPQMRFFVARDGAEALGCGALRVHPEGYGEVKRMFVHAKARGLKVGKRILAEVEAQARQEGLSCLRLETGIHQAEALGLYRAVGFVDRGPFGEYGPDPLSIFMEKPLMTTLAKNTRATVIPSLRYRDAPAAIEWLCRTFGFEKHLVVPNPDGTIAHAQLAFGNGMIMLGSVVDSEFGCLMKQPDEIGGGETQSAYVIVTDADVVYARAKAAGAKIVLDIEDKDYGGRGFSCRDLEGHLWNFGTYDPWSAHGG